MKDTVTLKQYFQVQIKNIKQSVKVAYASMDKRLEGMNEFRKQINDQSGKFITREAFDAKHDAMEKEIKELQLSKANLEGKASQNSVNIALAVACVGILIGIVNIFVIFYKK